MSTTCTYNFMLCLIYSPHQPSLKAHNQLSDPDAINIPILQLKKWGLGRLGCLPRVMALLSCKSGINPRLVWHNPYYVWWPFFKGVLKSPTGFLRDRTVNKGKWTTDNKRKVNKHKVNWSHHTLLVWEKITQPKSWHLSVCQTESTWKSQITHYYKVIRHSPYSWVDDNLVEQIKYWIHKCELIGCKSPVSSPVGCIMHEQPTIELIRQDSEKLMGMCSSKNEIELYGSDVKCYRSLGEINDILVELGFELSLERRRFG